MGVQKMDREKAQKLAEAFKDDWEIDPKAQHGLHKKTGFEIFMGGTYYDDEGHAHYECMFRATQEHPEEELTDEVIRRLQREAAILKEAGYMPGRTKYEKSLKERHVGKKNIGKSILRNMKNLLPITAECMRKKREPKSLNGIKIAALPRPKNSLMNDK